MSPALLVSASWGARDRRAIVTGALAAALGVGFVPIRKKGKLPHRTARAKYTLEYGVDELEVGLGVQVVFEDLPDDFTLFSFERAA